MEWIHSVDGRGLPWFDYGLGNVVSGARLVSSSGLRVRQRLLGCCGLVVDVFGQTRMIALGPAENRGRMLMTVPALDSVRLEPMGGHG